MNQGRQSKTALTLACTLAAIATLVAFAPAASAQAPAQSEYDIGALPGSNGDNQSPGTGETLSQSASEDGAPIGGDGGGSGPLLLIALAAVAAICTGFAVWRLREAGSDDDDDDRKMAGPDPTAGERQSA